MSNYFWESKPTLSANSLRWKSNDKTFLYWDGSKNVSISPPLKFYVIATTMKFVWFSPSLEKWIWSNEVQNTKKEALTVKAGNTFIQSWFYDKIKDEVTKAWWKYCSVLYCYNPKEKDMFKLELSWASLASWIGNKFNTSKWPIVWSWFEEWKKWATNYSFATFEQPKGDIPIKEYEQVMDKVQEVKDFFKEQKDYYDKTEKDLKKSFWIEDELKPELLPF